MKERSRGSSSEFDTLVYKKLDLQGDEVYSETTNDIITEEFRITNLDTDKFAIKIVMTGTNDLHVPKIKGMRAVALSQ